MPLESCFVGKIKLTKGTFVWGSDSFSGEYFEAIFLACIDLTFIIWLNLILKVRNRLMEISWYNVCLQGPWAPLFFYCSYPTSWGRKVLLLDSHCCLIAPCHVLISKLCFYTIEQNNLQHHALSSKGLTSSFRFTFLLVFWKFHSTCFDHFEFFLFYKPTKITLCCPNNSWIWGLPLA